MSVIKANNLSYSYPCGRKALDGVSCTVRRGATIGLVGANGAGKSTFLCLLCGLYMPQAGSVEVDGLELVSENLQAIRKKVGLVFQNADNQLFMPTVFDDVAFGPLNSGLSDDEARILAYDAMSKVGVVELAERAPYQLSGGEKRLAAIASVLSLQPQILAFDEPSTGLDPFSRRQFINVLNSLSQTKIIATHDLDLVIDTCDELIVLDKGKVAACGSLHDIFSNDLLLSSARLEKPLRLQSCPVCGRDGAELLR